VTHLLPTPPGATGRLPSADATTAALAALEDEGRCLDAKSRADRTWRGYRRDWRHFTARCEVPGRSRRDAIQGN
jgi:hypothetical protein